MFFEVFSLTYHSLITIESLTYRVLEFMNLLLLLLRFTGNRRQE